jgi:hypothetical protein
MFKEDSMPILGRSPDISGEFEKGSLVAEERWI